MEQLRKFARYFARYRWNVAVGISFILFSTIFGLVVPYLVGVAIDDLSEGITWEKTLLYPSLILLASLVSGVFLFWQRRLLIDASRHIEYEMRRDFYAALVGQPLEFFQNNRVGDLMARATNDLAAVRQIVGPMILYSFQAIFALLVVIPLMLSISVKLTLLMLIPLPFVSLTVKYLGQQIHRRFETIQEYFSGITARAQENLSGVRVIRAYAQEEAETEKFRELNEEYAKRNIVLARFSAAMRPLLFFFIGLGFVIIVAVGVPMAVDGEITPGNFASFILYLQRMVWYMIALGYVVNLYQRGTASLKRFDEILETEPAIRDGGDRSGEAVLEGRLEFRNLSFSYGDKRVLDGINLAVEPGQTVAFVGRTGSGKSTLVNLVPRLIEAPDGTLLIDGKPIKEIGLANLRKAIGFVPQETFLFSNTISDNIEFGIDEKDSKPVMTPARAAEVAGLAADIQGFPDGYAQLVGERGISLSGGQKQRTAIARAVMRNPRILILDDSLSAVDTYTEEQILRNLRDVRRDRTTLIVAHRVSTIRDADLICVIDDGRIIESGTHDELIALGGEYADLYQRQLLEEELESTE
jgi:ATP-binding cassette subfamily B protein